jgi:hypothetical protein
LFLFYGVYLLISLRPCETTFSLIAIFKFRIVQSFYESSGFTCGCDNTELVIGCSGTLAQYYTILVLAYDAAIQDYSFGVDCTCDTPACDAEIVDCVAVFVNDYTCAVSFEVTMSNVCADCSICSTETGVIGYAADACYSEVLGCIPTALVASVPGSISSPTDTQSPTQGSSSSTTTPTDAITTVPPANSLATSPPTDPFATAPPNGGQTLPNVGALGSGGALGAAHTGVMAVVTMVFLTISFFM